MSFKPHTHTAGTRHDSTAHRLPRAMKFVFRTQADEARVFTGNLHEDGALPVSVADVAEAFHLVVEGLRITSARGGTCSVKDGVIYSTANSFDVEGDAAQPARLGRNRNDAKPKHQTASARRRPGPTPSTPRGKPVRPRQRGVAGMGPSKDFEPSKEFDDNKMNEVVDFLHDNVYPADIRGIGLSMKRKDYKKNTRKRFRLGEDPQTGHVTLEKKRRTGEGARSGKTYGNAFARRMTTRATPWRRVLTEDEGWAKIHARHERGHDGQKRMRDLADDYVIHNLEAKLAGVCGDGCEVCSRFVPPPKAPPRAIITRSKFEIVMFDLSKFPYPDEDGYEMFMLVVDHFSKYMWFYPLKDKGEEGVNVALRDLFGPDGKNLPIPGRFHTDNGSEFINKLMEELREELLDNMEHTTSKPRNPQCQGLVEERNKVVKEKILKLAMADGWEEHIRTRADGKRVMDWVPLARKVVENENMNKCQTYGLAPYLCFHGVARAANMNPLTSEVTPRTHIHTARSHASRP